MKAKLTGIRAANGIMWFLFAVHLLLELLLWQVARTWIFHEMYYVPILCAGMALRYWWDRDTLVADWGRKCQIAGAVLWGLAAVVVTVVMVVDPGKHDSMKELFCRSCGQQTITWFLPGLAVMETIHQGIRFRRSKRGVDNVAAGCSVVVLAGYLQWCLKLFAEGSRTYHGYLYAAAIFGAVLLVIKALFGTVKLARQLVSPEIP